MVLNMRIKEEISPTLGNIVNRFNEDNRRPSDFFSSGEKPAEDSFNNEVEFDDGGNEDCVTWNHDHDDGTTMEDEAPISADSSFPDYQEVSFTFSPFLQITPIIEPKYPVQYMRACVFLYVYHLFI